MDFFGNVQGVEVEGGDGVGNETEWREDLRRLGEILRRKEVEDQNGGGKEEGPAVRELMAECDGPRERHAGAAKVEVAKGWSQRVVGASVLLGCAVIWGGASWFDSSR